MSVWQSRWKSRRYQFMAGLYAIADGLVRVISLGWLMPDWQFQHALRDANRETATDESGHKEADSE